MAPRYEPAVCGSALIPEKNKTRKIEEVTCSRCLRRLARKDARAREMLIAWEEMMRVKYNKPERQKSVAITSLWHEGDPEPEDGTYR